mmetsp:Transcript_52802/g.95032  ORF Transcript_52802/g.95032 Transcript_52802/m.95032 type:complete len:311 (+) Transcript_52802:171-1103(+)
MFFRHSFHTSTAELLKHDLTAALPLAPRAERAHTHVGANDLAADLRLTEDAVARQTALLCEGGDTAHPRLRAASAGRTAGCPPAKLSELAVLFLQMRARPGLVEGAVAWPAALAGLRGHPPPSGALLLKHVFTYAPLVPGVPHAVQGPSALMTLRARRRSAPIATLCHHPGSRARLAALVVLSEDSSLSLAKTVTSSHRVPLGPRAKLAVLGHTGEGAGRICAILELLLMSGALGHRFVRRLHDLYVWLPLTANMPVGAAPVLLRLRPADPEVPEPGIAVEERLGPLRFCMQGKVAALVMVHAAPMRLFI